jgi:hypothetical protein
MGKKIITLSLWSWKSLLLLYGKVVTLFFALFCVASGQSIKNSGGISKSESAAKNRVLFLSDSSAIKNVKLYFCRVSYPIYGTQPAQPNIDKVDSTYSDPNGYFEVPATVKQSYAIATEEITHDAGTKKEVFLTTGVVPPDIQGVTFYLYPISRTGIVNNVTDKNMSAQSAVIMQGKTATINIPELSNKIEAAAVLNMSGEMITQLKVLSNGEIQWNTERAAKGMYIITLQTKTNNLNVKVLVK